MLYTLNRRESNYVYNRSSNEMNPPLSLLRGSFCRYRTIVHPGPAQSNLIQKGVICIAKIVYPDFGLQRDGSNRTSVNLSRIQRW